ncbi:TetR/AcrR family transcriptional regulator [Streptomyces macrosporus]|uniref:HTH tetR-type domain-containing protein n=1 Tax=Streptomyces macrosporus TaxID=44032 RepID=A0ABP5XKI7_9ACTN
MSGDRLARRRDSARSRELLLRAAVELFAEKGFDRSTVREIGERAGVDPALIARYFGGKTQLYIAALRAERGDTVRADLLDPEYLLELLERVDRRGPGPLLRAVVQPHADPEAQDAARATLYARLVEPLRERFAREGRDRPELRAEIVVAAFVGVLLGRRSGVFDGLARVGSDDLAALLRDTLAPDGDRPPPHRPE